MDSFNYRIVRKTDPVRYAIHEAFYDKDGKVEAITEDPVYPEGETKDKLFIDVDLMLGAMTKPVINYHDVGGK